MMTLDQVNEELGAVRSQQAELKAQVTALHTPERRAAYEKERKKLLDAGEPLPDDLRAVPADDPRLVTLQRARAALNDREAALSAEARFLHAAKEARTVAEIDADRKDLLADQEELRDRLRSLQVERDAALLREEIAKMPAAKKAALQRLIASGIPSGEKSGKGGVGK